MQPVRIFEGDFADIHVASKDGISSEVLETIRNAETGDQKLFKRYIEQYRNTGQISAPSNIKAIGAGLFELRGDQLRVIFYFRPGTGHRSIVLVHALIKKRDDIPSKDLDKAKDIRKAIEK